MGRNVFSKAGEWLRRVRAPIDTEGLDLAGGEFVNVESGGDVRASEPLTLDRIASDPAAAGVLVGADLRLLEFVGEDLTQRSRALREAVRDLDPTSTGSSLAAHRRSLEELDKLEDMASALCAVVNESRRNDALVPADLLEPIRRAVRQSGDRRPSQLTVRVNTPTDLPRVLARPAVLVRTLGLCLDASSLVSLDGGPLLVRISGGERVCAQFKASASLSVLAPGLRRRLHTTLALARRLAATFGAELDVDASDGALAPRLLLLRESAH
jgi:hypothetical protein